MWSKVFYSIFNPIYFVTLCLFKIYSVVYCEVISAVSEHEVMPDNVLVRIDDVTKLES